MSNNTNIEETIELFVKGKLTEPALSDFQNLMQTDKTVVKEVKLQQLTTQAIVEHRRLALKSRLDSINVGASGGNAPNTFAKYFSIKSAAIVVATVGVGISAYFYTQSQIDAANDSATQANQTLILDSVTQDGGSNENNTQQIAINRQQSSEIENNTEVKVESSIERVEKPKVGKSFLGLKKKKTSANGEQMLDQKFEDGSEADIAANMPKSPVTIATGEKVVNTADVDIKNVQDGRHSFHYMLKESTLFLYGNFDASPYEILEFNEKEGQSIYLFYDQSFFTLKKGQTEPIKLKRISDNKLVQDLTEARNKKH